MVWEGVAVDARSSQEYGGNIRIRCGELSAKLPVRDAAERLPDGPKRGSVKNFSADCHCPVKQKKTPLTAKYYWHTKKYEGTAH